MLDTYSTYMYSKYIHVIGGFCNGGTLFKPLILQIKIPSNISSCTVQCTFILIVFVHVHLYISCLHIHLYMYMYIVLLYIAMLLYTHWIIESLSNCYFDVILCCFFCVSILLMPYPIHVHCQ